MRREVTQEDLDLNPELVDLEFGVGDVFDFDEESTEEGEQGSRGLDDDSEINPLPPGTKPPVIP